MVTTASKATHDWLRDIATEAERMGVELMDLENLGGRVRFAVKGRYSIIGYLEVVGEPPFELMDILRRLSIAPPSPRT